MDVTCPLCEGNDPYTGSREEVRAHINGSGGSGLPDDPHTGYGFTKADQLLDREADGSRDLPGRLPPPEPDVDVVEERMVVDEGDGVHVAEVAEGTPEELAEHIEEIGQAMNGSPEELAARTEQELAAAPPCTDCGEGPVAPLKGALAEANSAHVDDFTHICLGCRELIDA